MPTWVAVRRLAIAVPVFPIAPEGGVLYPPGNPRELGWFRYGARPGDVRGSAVITGHTVHTGGGALDELDDLRAGDTVRVTTTNGTIIYRVSEVSIVSKTQFARTAEKIFSSTVPGRLVLITCTDWDGQRLPQQHRRLRHSHTGDLNIRGPAVGTLRPPWLATARGPRYRRATTREVVALADVIRAHVVSRVSVLAALLVGLPVAMLVAAPPAAAADITTACPGTTSWHDLHPHRQLHHDGTPDRSERVHD